jgi:serine phosphatase RsbU (regulator of sigma subunit)
MARILAVDDIEDNVFLLRVILENLGHTVLSAGSGPEALTLVRIEQVDLILLDIMMPVMSGLEVARILKSDDATRHIPIIMLTARKSDVTEVVEGLNAGAEEYLTKPFKEAELVARVASMLRMKGLYDQVAAANRIMEEELVMAKAMQTSMLPTRFPYPKQLTFAGRYEATAAVGGDYYDVIDYGNGQVGLVVADVSGHGPSAALIVAMIKVMIVASGGEGTISPAAVVEAINHQLVTLIPDDKFLTMFFGVVNVDDKTLTYIRAAHPFPYLIREGNAVEPLKAAGDLIGMFDEISLEEVTITLQSGDRLLGYSDGIIEALDEDQHQYGMGKLARALDRGRELSNDELLDTILAEVKDHSITTSLEDDAALLLMQVR